MSLVFRNALMPSENQQVLRLRLIYLMRRLRLIIQLLGLSALLVGSIVGTFIVVEVVVFVSLTWWFATRWFAALILFISSMVLITLYWRFIVFEVFKHVRKSLRQKVN